MKYILIVYFIVVSIVLSYRYSKVISNRLSLEKFLYLILGFFYLFIPIIYLLIFDSLKANTYNFWVLGTELTFSSMFYTFIIYSLSFLGIFTGFNLGKRVKIKVRVYEKKDIQKYMYIIVFLACLASLLTFLYAYRVGGIVSAIVEANSFRGHGEREPPIGQLAKFQPFILTTTLLLIAYGKGLKYLFLPVAILFLMFEASRANFGMFIIIIYIFHVNNKSKFNILKLSMPVIIAVFLAVIGNTITNYISTGLWYVSDSAFYSLISQFSPSFSNILNIQQFTENYGFGFLYDVTSIFPQTLFGFEKTVKTWQFLTEYYLGGFYTVGIPIDLLSYSFSQFGFFGSFILPFIYFFIFGVISKYINNMLLIHENGDVRKITLMVELICCMFMASLISWASVDSTVFYGTIKYWFVIILFIYLPFFRMGGRRGEDR
nr:hypothetical protein BCT18_21330 [Vibrio cyclitrophicus]